jgi:hypothetical protein
MSMLRWLLASLLTGAAALALTAVTTATAGAPSDAELKRATNATFVGGWIGHTRSLSIRSGGHATESIYSGCCDPVINLTFRLSRPRGTTKDASAVATVTGVWVRDRIAFTKASPAPRVGERRAIRLRDGVIDETLTGAVYCNQQAENVGKCGA